MDSSAAPTTSEVVESLRRTLPHLLVTTDFDGTLAPLVLDPERSRPVAGAIEALSAVARAGARVAVITGRAAAAVVRIGGLDAVPGLEVAGLYGAETWRAGAVETLDTPESLEVLRRRLPETVAGACPDPTLWIEDKRLSLVVHARRAADPPAALHAIRAPVEQLANELGLEAHPGSGVLEIRLPGFDKAGALRRLVDETAATGVLFLGDDLGDIPAFAEIRRLRAAGRTAWGAAVLTSRAALDGAADLELADPAAAVDLLAALAR